MKNTDQQPTTTNSVLLVEDDPQTRERLTAVINGHPQLILQAAVENCADARSQLEQGPPRVLLTDLGLPDGNGIELITETQQNYPQTECMVMSVFGDEKSVIDAFAAGARGYLLKDGTAEHIGKSILQLLSGGAPISAAVAGYLLKRFQPTPEPDDPAPQLLTSREREILEYIELGYHYQEIASTLHVSFHTVNTHLKNIYRKLEVKSRQQAVRAARQQGLLRPDGK